MSASTKRRPPRFYTLGHYALRRDPGPTGPQWRVFDVSGPSARLAFVAPTLEAAWDWCQGQRGATPDRPVTGSY